MSSVPTTSIAPEVHATTHGRRSTEARCHSKQAPCFLFAGGGTGGHLFPGIAVAAELAGRIPQAEIVFAGTGRDWERDHVQRAGFEYRTVPSHPLPRNPIQLPGAVCRNIRGYRQIVQWLSNQDVTAVIGLGSYACAPIVKAAIHRQIPVFLLEQNVVPGTATRWLAASAHTVFTAFEQTAAYLTTKARVQCVGNPLRREIIEAARGDTNPVTSQPDVDSTAEAVAAEITNLKAEFSETTAPHTLLILGGSQGAQSVNHAILAALANLTDRVSTWRIIHQTGQKDLAQVRRAYRRLPFDSHVRAFFADMGPLYDVADLVVCRAGATTLAELACAGLPAVLLPYPEAAHDHQRANARRYADVGAAVIVTDSRRSPRATAQRLKAVLADLLENPHHRASMACAMDGVARPTATADVVDELFAVTRITATA